jgi:cell division septum initiation protein DivIVA
MRKLLAALGGAGVLLAVLAQVDVLSRHLAEGLTCACIAGLALFAPASGSVSELSSAGMSGAAAYEAARPYLPLVASGLLLAFVFGTRATRSRSLRELVFHLGGAFVAGTAASWVSRTETPADVALWLLGITLAAVLASAPWLVPNETLHSLLLRRLAARAEGPLRVRLLRAAIVARRLEAPTAEARRTLEDVRARAERVVGASCATADAELIRRVDELARATRVPR